jgi:hypothetical protein
MVLKMKRMRRMIINHPNPMELFDQHEKRKHQENMYAKEKSLFNLLDLLF